MFLSQFTRRVFASRFAVTSLFLHVVLITLLGGVVLFKTATQNEAFVGAVASDNFLADESNETSGDDVAEPQEFDEPAQAQLAVESPKSFDAGFSALASTEAAAWSMNAPTQVYATGNSGGGGSSLGAIGNGGSRAGGGSGRLGPPTSRTLFGTKVEAANLGALVDISGSAMPYLEPSLREVQKSFDNCPVVLAVGCGLLRGKGDLMPLNKADLEQKAPPGVMSGAGSLHSAMSRNKEVERLVRKLQRTPDAYLVENNTLDVGLGFERLIDSKVDAIYWFADFRDGVNPAYAKEISSKLKNRGIKLYIHTFTGKPVPPDQAAMVEATGGKIISEVPK